MELALIILPILFIVFLCRNVLFDSKQQKAEWQAILRRSERLSKQSKQLLPPAKGRE